MAEDKEKGEQNKFYLIKDVEEYQKAKLRLIETYELMQDLRKRFFNDPIFRKNISSTSCII